MAQFNWSHQLQPSHFPDKLRILSFEILSFCSAVFCTFKYVIR